MNQIARGQNVIFSKKGRPPEIQVVINSVAIGFYVTFLACGGTEPSEICRGASNQPVKSCPIGDSSKLSGCEVSWNIGVAQGPFTQSVILTQEGTTLAKFVYPPGQGEDSTVDFVTMVGQ